MKITVARMTPAVATDDAQRMSASIVNRIATKEQIVNKDAGKEQIFNSCGYTLWTIGIQTRTKSHSQQSNTNCPPITALRKLVAHIELHNKDNIILMAFSFLHSGPALQSANADTFNVIPSWNSHGSCYIGSPPFLSHARTTKKLDSPGDWPTDDNRHHLKVMQLHGMVVRVLSCQHLTRANLLHHSWLLLSQDNEGELWALPGCFEQTLECGIQKDLVVYKHPFRVACGQKVTPYQLRAI